MIALDGGGGNHPGLEGMRSISQHDYEMLLDSLRELHSFADQPALLSWLLDTALPRLIPSDWFSYNEVDLRNPGNTVALLKPESDTLFQRLFPRFQAVAHQHPLITRQLQSPDFPVHKISDFLTREAYHQLDLYREVYQPMGVEYQIAAPIRLDPEHVTAFALSRREADYTERDRAILEMLRPHLVVAFNRLALSRAHQAVLDGTAVALQELSSATLIVDLCGRMLYHTGSGLEWIGARAGDFLPARISRWLNGPTVTGTRETLRLVSHAGEIHIRALPTSSPERRLLVLTQQNAPRRSASEPVDFGLSDRELEVAHWIREGKTNAEIGTILVISPRTVQKHIEHLFEKMGVETRTAVARRLGD